MNHPVPPELPGTKPPTKECTWRDPWLQLHMRQRMALLEIKGGLGPEKAQSLCKGEWQDKEVGVGAWVNRGRGDGLGGFQRGKQERG